MEGPSHLRVSDVVIPSTSSVSGSKDPFAAKEYDLYRSVLSQITTSKSGTVTEPVLPTRNARQRYLMESRHGGCISRYQRDERGFLSFKKLVKDHIDGEAHAMKHAAVKKIARRLAAPLQETPLEMTIRYTRTVFIILKRGLAMRSQSAGAVMGTNHYSRKKGRQMAQAISTVLHRRLYNHLKDGSSPISFLTDGTEDRAQNKLIGTQVRVLINEYPVTLTWELLSKKQGDKGSDYVGRRHTRSTDSMATTTSSQPLRTTLVVITTDGASAMTSTMWRGMGTLRKNIATNGGRHLPNVWCRAHLLETIVKEVQRHQKSCGTTAPY